MQILCRDYVKTVNKGSVRKERIIMIPVQVISDSTKASFAMEGMYAT